MFKNKIQRLTRKAGLASGWKTERALIALTRTPIGWASWGIACIMSCRIWWNTFRNSIFIYKPDQDWKLFYADNMINLNSKVFWQIYRKSNNLTQNYVLPGRSSSRLRHTKTSTSKMKQNIWKRLFHSTVAWKRRRLRECTNTPWGTAECCETENSQSANWPSDGKLPYTNTWNERNDQKINAEKVLKQPM